MNNEWQIIPAHAIDVHKWNACISQSNRPLIYAYTFYLNALCPQWIGLILNNYEAVMPVPIKKKWSITYCYLPVFIQQLGLFQKNHTTYPVDAILQWVTSQFKYGDLYIPFYQSLPNLPNCSVQVRDNFILDLKNEYTSIAAGYSGDLKRNLSKANHHHLVYHNKVNVQTILNQFYQAYHRAMHLQKANLNAFATLLLQKEMQLHFFARAVNDVKGNLIAGGIFLKDDYRIYNIVNFTNSTGRKHSANHFLLDQCIQEFAGTGMVFDFEGSSQKGIQAFYKNFHPTPEPYLHIHINQLPVPIRYLKQ